MRVCACVRIFSCETSITGAVNYEQFVQLLNWKDHPLSREGRPKVQDHNGYWPAVRYLIYLLLHTSHTLPHHRLSQGPVLCGVAAGATVVTSIYYSTLLSDLAQ